METVYRRRLPAAHSGLHVVEYYNPARVTANPDDWQDRETARGRRARRRAFARSARIDRAILMLADVAGGVK